ncbi:hypothetical protein Tco_0002649 [Tanacetum coccineum]
MLATRLLKKTACEPNTYRRDLLETLDTLEAVIHRAVITYGRLICKGTNSYKQETSSNSGNYITHVVDADIRPVNDQVPSVEVHLTAQQNVLANEQWHTDKSEPSYDIYLLEKVDINTTPDATNMCHRGGEIDQDVEQYQAKIPLLKAEFLKMNDMDAPEFCEFFEINDLKAQLQAKTTLICNLKNQIKSVKEASHEAKVNSHVKVQSPKTRNNNKPVEPKCHTQKPSRQIAIGQRFSLNKSSDVHEKPNIPRSCLRLIPTGRIFKLAGLRWIPTRKLFDSCTSKVDSEPPNGSNDDITNPYECNQTLNVSACTLNLSASTSFNPIKEILGFRPRSSTINDVCSHQFRPRSSTIDDVCSHQFRPRSSTIDDVCSHQFRPRSSTIDDLYSHQFSPRSSTIDDYFNPPPCVVSPDPVAVAAPRHVDPAGSPLSTTIDQDVPSASTTPINQEIQFQVTHQGVEEQIHGHQNA